MWKPETERKMLTTCLSTVFWRQFRQIHKPNSQTHVRQTSIPIDWSEETRPLKYICIFQNAIDLHENTATNMYHRYFSLDEASKMCGVSAWVKINCHIYTTPVNVNGKLLQWRQPTCQACKAMSLSVRLLFLQQRKIVQFSQRQHATKRYELYLKFYLD